MIRLTTDLLEAPGGRIPPLIGGYRPDIVARYDKCCLHLIAEAKTDGDIDNSHTWNQISAFVSHLGAASATGVFVLAVNGHVASAARPLLQFLCRQHVSTSLHIELFDGLDFWALGASGEPLWRLC